MAQNVVHRPRHSAPRVERSEHHASQFGEHDRAGALRARLERDVECGQEKAILAHPVEGPMEGQELRMRGRIAPFDGLVVSLGQDFPIRDDNGANRHFLAHRCHPSQSERGLHPREVAGRWCSPTHWPLRRHWLAPDKAEVFSSPIHPDRVPLAKSSFEHLERDRILKLALDHPLERPRTIDRVVALRRERLARLGRHLEPQMTGAQLVLRASASWMSTICARSSLLNGRKTMMSSTRLRNSGRK